MKPLSHRGGSLAVFAALCIVPCLLPAAAPVPALEAGFNGFVKPGCWFPVRITNAPAPAAYDMFVMSQGWCGGRPSPAFRAAGFVSGPESTVMCMMNDSSGEQFIQCAFAAPSGRKQVATCRIKPLSQNDLLVLVVSESPHSFDFLGGIQLPDRGIVCAVPTPAAALPAKWRELDCVDIVVLDQPPETAGREAQECLLNWTVAGGTLILTARACDRPGGTDAAWPVPPPAPAPGGEEAAAMLAPMLGEFAKHAISVPARSFDVPPTERLLGDEKNTILAARDVGAGRVIAVGFDWQAMEMRDRMFIEGARHAVWSGLIALNRPPSQQSPGNDLVTPEEAKARFLTRYIAVFLAVYVLLLGPVNWLVLRKIGRMEYSIVTLPAGAVLFAMIAFLLGLALRSDRTILREAEFVLVHNADRGLLTGTVGVLAPDRQPYTLSLADGDGVLEPDGERHMGGRETGRLRDMPVYHSSDGFSASNVKVGMWSIKYFKTRGVLPLGGSVGGILAVGANGLDGTLTNGTHFAIRDAVLFHRWNRVLLGSIEPGAVLAVSMPLAPASRKVFGKCHNCGRYHGTDSSLSEKYCRDNPLPDGMREFAAGLELNAIAPLPVLAGWLDAPATSVDSGRDVCDGSARRFCVFVLPVSADGPEISIPEGFLAENAFSGERAKSAKYVQNIRSFTLAGGSRKQGSDSYGMSPDTCYGDMNYGELAQRYGRESAPSTREFLLPFRSAGVRTDALHVHWDIGQPDDEEGVCTQVLAAFDWDASAWVDLALAGTGVEQTVSVASPSRFLGTPDCVIALRTLVETNRARSVSANFVEIAWKGAMEPE